MSPLQDSAGDPETAPSALAPVSVSILIVDDNPSKRLALTSILSPLGHRIVEAVSGREALRCLLAEDFAVILLDVCMPIMDGFETAHLIRQRPRSEMTPIIFVTAHESNEVSQADHYVQGAVDFITAPFAPTELRAKVTVFGNLFLRAQELAARAQQVQTSADQLRLLTDAAPIGIFQTDAENRLVSTNPYWSEITGVSADQARGQGWDIFLDPDQRAKVVAERPDHPELRSEFCQRFELRRPASTRIVLLTSRRIPDTQGGGAGWIGTLADMTAEANAEAAMSEARDAALAANAMQLNFTASASHELKTPTTSILGFLEEVLESETLSDEDRGFLDIVYRNAGRLSQLIDDLLILGQSEIDASMMHLEPLSVGVLIDGVMANFSATAQRGGISLTSDQDSDVSWALGDPQRVEQALSNLVSNAIKFTPEGGAVTIAVHAHDDSVDVSVADTGMGIAPDDVDKVFGRFFRTDQAVDVAIKGSGLGLAIAKRMIEAQGGELAVTSTLGIGSTFTMTLPVAARSLEAVR
jgi:PAS domain S-box-containing protein